MVAAGLVDMMRLHEVRSLNVRLWAQIRWMLPTTPNYIQGVDMSSEIQIIFEHGIYCIMFLVSTDSWSK